MNNIKLFLAVILFSNYLFSQDIKQTKELPNVVPVSWIKQNIDNKRLVILDIREYSDYKKGHVKGAVNLPGLKNLFDAKTWMMPKLDFLKKLLVKLE